MHSSRLLLCLALTTTTALAQWSESTTPAIAASVGAKAGPYLLFPGGGAGMIQAFDTTTGTWVASQPLSMPRGGLSAVTVGSRAVFSGGSSGGLDGSTVVDVYDASLGIPSDAAAWSTLTLPTARRDHSSASLGTKVFFARGINNGGSTVATADVYDFATAAWSSFPLSAGGSGSAAVAVGTKVLIAGGSTFSLTTDSVDIYDDATGTWSTASLSVARGGTPFARIGATSVGSRAYFAGGRLDWFTGGSTNVVDIYDAATGTWTVETMSRARFWVSVASVGDRILFAGGGVSGALNDTALDVVDVLDLTTGEWHETRLTRPRTRMAAVTEGDSIYFVGGRESPPNFNSNLVEVYTSPELALAVPDAPDTLDRDGAVVPVEFAELVHGAYVTGTAMLHFDAGAGPVQVPLQSGGPTGLQAVFPPFDCGTTVDWYVSADTSTGATLTYPDRPTLEVLTSRAADSPLALSFDMETGAGWTSGDAGDSATAGLWERGEPVGGTETSPERDRTPGAGGACWVTGLAAGEDLDGGTATLYSPPLDLSSVLDPWIGYWRWYAADSNADRLTVSVTLDGSQWTEVETVRLGSSPPIVYGGWVRHGFRLLDVPGAWLSDTVQLRFVAEDSSGDDAVECAIDDVFVAGCRDGLGGATCTAIPNSTGASGRLEPIGSPVVADDDVTLVADQLPLNASGYFLASRDIGLTPVVANSAGTLCLGGAIGRYVGPGQVLNSGTAGEFSLALDLMATPTPTGLVAITAGEAWHFQAWYRDTSIFGATSNFTNGYVIVFE